MNDQRTQERKYAMNADTNWINELTPDELRETLHRVIADRNNERQRAEAAEADARDVRAWADAVPVEAIRRVWKSSHTADMAAERKVRQWLEKQVQP